MSAPSNSSIVVDTCVFEHTINPERNPDCHIEQLLSLLLRSGAVLCVDDTKRIRSEYRERLTPIIKGSDESRVIIRVLLSYWLDVAHQRETAIESNGQLMKRIRSVIVEKGETIDHLLVAVACVQDCKLITNDQQHILDRRTPLRKATRRCRGKCTDFVSSRNALDALRGDEVG